MRSGRSEKGAKYRPMGYGEMYPNTSYGEPPPSIACPAAVTI
jgi:hypothetical protein